MINTAPEKHFLKNEFDYLLAFSRNIGFVTPEEQLLLKHKRVAIPGMGGVGGHHVHTLARMGVGEFHIADFDAFEVHNFNRQIGANMSTIGHEKVEVMRDMLLDINPESYVKTFPKGVNEDNYDEFLDGVDLVIDSLDVFVLDHRIKLYDFALRKGIPVLTAAPLGLGTSIIAFHPEKMGFCEYFNIKLSTPEEDKFARFLVGVSPKSYHAKYIKPEFVNAKEGKVPSNHVGVISATAAMGAFCFKYFLNREGLRWAPHGLSWDLYNLKWSKFYVPLGNRNPWQKLKVNVVKKVLST